MANTVEITPHLTDNPRAHLTFNTRMGGLFTRVLRALHTAPFYTLRVNITLYTQILFTLAITRCT